MKCKNKHFRRILIFIEAGDSQRGMKFITYLFVSRFFYRTNWFKKFRFGDSPLKDDQTNSGRPSEVDNNKMKAIIKSNIHINELLYRRTF